VTELDRCTHLAALDQVGVRFENRIEGTSNNDGFFVGSIAGVAHR
jgi:hypothetical protein